MTFLISKKGKHTKALCIIEEAIVLHVKTNNNAGWVLVFFFIYCISLFLVFFYFPEFCCLVSNHSGIYTRPKRFIHDLGFLLSQFQHSIWHQSWRFDRGPLQAWDISTTRHPYHVFFTFTPSFFFFLAVKPLSAPGVATQTAYLFLSSCALEAREPRNLCWLRYVWDDVYIWTFTREITNYPTVMKIG